jgi:hypothetical protein
MLLALLAAATASTAPSLPDGWREPTTREIQEAAKVWREVEKRVQREPDDRPYRDPVYALQADFDGDGRTDRAALLINAEGSRGVFVHRAASGRYEPLDVALGGAPLAHYGFEILEPGEYTDITDRGDHPLVRVKIALPSIHVAYGESSSQTFYWDGRAFATIWLTD